MPGRTRNCPINYGQLNNEVGTGCIKRVFMIEYKVIEALNQVVICTNFESRPFGCHILIMSIGSKVS